MHISLSNGELKCEKCVFSPGEKIDSLKTALSDKMELWTSNENWRIYRWVVSDQYILAMFFEYEKLYMIGVYPSDQSDDAISILLQELGGEGVYDWGKVYPYNDIKSGSKKVIVQYN